MMYWYDMVANCTVFNEFVVAWAGRGQSEAADPHYVRSYCTEARAGFNTTRECAMTAEVAINSKERGA
jgi:hypothetical protein